MAEKPQDIWDQNGEEGLRLLLGMRNTINIYARYGLVVDRKPVFLGKMMKLNCGGCGYERDGACMVQ